MKLLVNQFQALTLLEHALHRLEDRAGKLGFSKSVDRDILPDQLPKSVQLVYEDIKNDIRALRRRAY